MAKRTYANIFGVMDYDKAAKDLKNAKSSSAALNIVETFITDTYAGALNVGVSKSDQTKVYNLINAYGKQFKTDVSNAAKLWSSGNDIKSNNVASVKTNTMDMLYGRESKPSTNTSTPTTYTPPNQLTTNNNSGYTPPNTLSGTKSAAAQAAANYKAGGGGTSSGGGGTGSGGGSRSGGSGALGGGGGGSRNNANDNYATYNPNLTSTAYTPAGYTAPPIYENTIKELANEVISNSEEIPEIPRFMTAAEIAAMHDIDYDENLFLNEENKATNDFYNAAIAEQARLRNQYNQNNANYINQIANEYLNSYDNMARTSVNNATLAANMLSTYLAGNETNSADSYGMLQSINQLEKERQAELAQNPYEARQRYNDIGNFLRNYSTDYYNSAITDYASQIKAYGTQYAAQRYLAKQAANDAATKYSGLANAAISNASTAASNAVNNQFQNMWNYYNAIGGSDYANKTVNNILKTGTGTTNTYGGAS